MFKAKYAIVPIIEVGPMEKVSKIIYDDNGSAKELWDTLVKLYKTSNK